MAEYFQDSPYKAVNFAYPGRFRQWQFNLGNNYWDSQENVEKAVIWLVEDKLKLTKKEAYKKLRRKDFYGYGLGAVLNKEKTVKNVLDNIYGTSSFSHNRI